MNYTPPFYCSGVTARGIWCDRCLKPSGYKLTIYGLYDSGVGQVMVETRCFDCKGFIHE